MFFYMYGFDTDKPDESMGELKRRGFDAVVAGSFNEKALEALYKYGLDGYGCYGAFPCTGRQEDKSYLAKDHEDLPRLWFSSGCPNEKHLWDRGFKKAENFLKTPGLKGVFSDGARFASFASSEGIESFFTCFCERCAKKAAELGFDFQKMKKEASKASDILLNRGSFDSFSLIVSSEWMKFRRICITEYFETVRQKIKDFNKDLVSGGFVFTPSLSPFTGQDKEAVRTLDIYAPMVYRKYPYENGPACLNHEWHAVLSRTAEYTGTKVFIDYDFSKTDSIRKEGFPPEIIGTETEKAVDLMGNPKKVMPIIQLEDDKLSESIRAVYDAKAGGCGFFAYKIEHMRFLPDLEPFT